MNIVQVFGWVGMSILTIFLCIAILLLFNTRLSIRPENYHYLFAAFFGGVFGSLLGIFAYWIGAGKARSDNKTLRIAIVITSIVTATVFFWVYALIIAAINELGTPYWAHAVFAASVLSLMIWAAKHQLDYQKNHSKI